MSERDERFQTFRAQALLVIDKALHGITTSDARNQNLRLWVDVANVGMSEAVTSAGACIDAEMPARPEGQFRVVLPLPADTEAAVKIAWDLCHGIV